MTVMALLRMVGSGRSPARPAPRSRMTAALTVTVLALGGGAALAAYLAVDRAHQAAAPGPVALPPGPAAVPAGPAAAPGPRRLPAAARQAPLRLVAGSRLVNGLYLSYPHSRPGAVSAAVEFITELGSTLEPGRAATVARLAAASSYRDAARDAAAGAAGTRRRLGLPASGSLPPGTAVALVPVLYQLRDVTADHLTVLLLFDYTEMVPGGIREHLGVTAARMTWTVSAWRLLPPAGLELSGLLATPGTASARAQGWEAMTGGM